MTFLTVKRTLGFKIEGTPYTAETLAVANYNVPAFNINYDNDVAMYARRIARGDFSRDPSIAGKRSITVSFSVDLAWSGTATTAPSYFPCLRACALKQISGVSNVVLKTDADYANVPATIEVVEKAEGASASQLVIKAHGCMGNAKLVCDAVGKPVRLDFEFKGVYNGITDRAFAAILVPTGFDTPNPEAMLGVTSTIFSETQKYDKFTFDLGNDVQVWTDPSKAQGLEGARVVDRNPTLEIDPDMGLIATTSMFTRHINNTTGAVSISVGNHLTISAPAAQLDSSYKPGEREGHVVNNLKFGLKRSLGNDELSITHA